MELKAYGADALFLFPLVNAGAVDFEAGVTIAAGDAKVFTDALILTNISCESVAFTSGSEEPTNGDTLDGATSAESCTFMFAVVTSGTWGGGDAAGVLFVKTVSGAFQAENLNINGGTANVMTIGADFTAGLFGAVGSGYYAVALTAAEMTCATGFVSIMDSATKEWEDQAIRFETYGNAAAQHAVDLNDSVRLGLSALPAAAADAAGGLPISDAGGLDLDAMNAAAVRLTAVRAAVLTDWIDGGRLDLLLDAIPTTAMRGTDNAATEAKQDIIDMVVDAIRAVTDLHPDAGALNDLATLAARLTAGRATNLDNLDATVSSRGTSANQMTILNRIGAFTGSGINTILGFFLGLLKSDASVPSDVGGTYDPAFDSLEAIRNTAPLGTAMRGTDGAYTGTPPTAAAIADATWDEAKAGHVAGGSFGLALADLYHADIQITIDEANTQDEITVTWFKNGIRVTSGITLPLIQIVKRADGTDLVASTAMTQIGSTGSYKYDEATNRLTNGEALLMIATATIDGSARSFAKVGARDSVAP